MKTKKDIYKLLRYHRQHVFDDITGKYHERALDRLKKTKTWKQEMIKNENEAKERKSNYLLRLYN